MKKGSSLIPFLLLVAIPIFAQSDTSHLRITLLTSSPASEPPSAFGHSALRVTDSIACTDSVYHYSGSDATGAVFIKKFIRGKLLYALRAETYVQFLQGYQHTRCSITEQELNLDAKDKTTLLNTLQTHVKGENGRYPFDFLFDNGATRIKDLVKHNTAEPIIVKPILPYAGISYRELIHNCLNQEKEYWAKLGIDVALGNAGDKSIQNEQAMFLPEYLSKAFDSAVINNMPLVKKKQTILEASNQRITSRSFLSPFNVFTAVFFAFLLLNWVPKPRGVKILQALDFLLFFSTGLLGMALLAIWMGSGYAICRNNYNLFWAIPFHAIAAFYINRNGKRTNQYWALAVILYALLLVFWVLIPQELNKDLLPLILLLGWRCWKQFKQSAGAGKVNSI